MMMNYNVNILKEYTGRFSATLALIKSISNKQLGNNKITTTVFDADEIEKICCSARIQQTGSCVFVYVILGENDIVKWGPCIRKLAPENSIHLYPTLDAARIETSKTYCRSILSEINNGIYNPKYIELGVDVIDKLNDKISGLTLSDWVIKCDGLANGKGVWVGDIHFKTQESGMAILQNALERGPCVLEERLTGQEFSIHTLYYGQNFKVHTPCVRDFKRRYAGDTDNTGCLGTALKDGIGPNTGGMGTISFAHGLMPFLTADEYSECCRLNEMIASNIGFTGVLYGSFIKTDMGEIKVIEYNCRPGDSEWINLLMLLDMNKMCSSLVSGDDSLMSSILYRKEASICTYIVDVDYAKSDTSGCSHIENYFTLDSVCDPSLCGYFAANAILESSVKCRDNTQFCGYVRHKYNYTKPGRLMAVCATGVDMEELIDIHNSMSHMVKGARLDWRRDIPTYLHTVPSPISSHTGTPRNSQYHIEYISNGEENITYIAHLDNYNSIMDHVKIDIETVNKRIIDKLSDIGSSPALELTGEIGDFANSIRSGGMTLICSVDGAGTKTKFMSEHPDRFHVLGHDVIIHNINDMLCNGGTPVAFLDYYGCDRLNPNEFSEYIHGILEVCESEGIPLIGGETAEMRGIYHPGECEVLGILMGVALNGTRNGGCDRVQNGTLIYGIRSHGAHTNGFTKLREIRNKHPMPEWVYEYFCRPHRNYRPVFEALSDVDIHPVAKAHITGGGFIDNLMRVVSKDQSNKLQPLLEPWELSREWDWVFQHSALEWDEFIRVFNAGFGMCFMVNEPIDHGKLSSELLMDIQLLGAFI